MSTLAFTPHKTGRKKLAQLLADHLGVKATYLGTPSFAYQIADATLDRDWTLYLPDGIEAQAVLEAVRQAGFETANPGEVALTVTMPTTGWSERIRANLEALLAAKGPLIAKALGIPATPVEFNDDQTVSFPWCESITPETAREAVVPLVAKLPRRQPGFGPRRLHRAMTSTRCAASCSPWASSAPNTSRHAASCWQAWKGTPLGAPRRAGRRTDASIATPDLLAPGYPATSGVSLVTSLVSPRFFRVL